MYWKYFFYKNKFLLFNSLKGGGSSRFENGAFNHDNEIHIKVL